MEMFKQEQNVSGKVDMCYHYCTIKAMRSQITHDVKLAVELSVSSLEPHHQLIF